MKKHQAPKNSPLRHNQWYERILLSPLVGHLLALLGVMAGSHLLAYGDLEPDDINRWRTMIAVGAAYALSCILRGQLNRFPVARSPVYLLGVTGTVFASLFGLLLLTRLGYARGILFSGFILTLAMQFAGFYINKRFRQLKLAVGPIGQPIEEQKVVGIRWVKLEKPDFMGRRFDGLVLDLDSPLPEDWARFVAHVSVERVPVFNLKHVIEDTTGRMQLNRLTVNDMGSLQPNPFYEEFRRATELALILALSPLWLPLMGIISLIVKLDSPGPAFFVQERVGRANRVFRMYKFRSMRVQPSDQPARFADSDAHRITRIGKFIRKTRLDEIPQFLNILKGDMSLIGPRPEQPAFVERFEKEVPFYTYRHMVRPGITGWAQVQQGYATDTESTKVKVEYDFYYIQHLSAWLDLLIVLKTVKTIFTGFGSR